MTSTMRFGVLGLATVGLAGCSQPRPVTMAPPVAPPAPPAMTAGAPNSNEVYNWRDVPAGQQVPITRAVFDQGGYQLYAASGETIVVPFENQNMYVMKFGRTSGDMYFVNDGNTAPTLYIREGQGLQNAAAQGALWYPFPQNYAYTRPVYMGIAPSWSDYTAMGWYPGMHYYGGYYSYSPWRVGLAYAAMPGLMINIGGRPYYGWNSYNSYYRSNPVNRVLVTNRNSYNYSSVGRRSASAGSSFGRSTGGSGSFGRTATGRTTGGGFSASRPSFGSGSRPSGSFGSGSSASRPSFGSGSSSASRPSFGGGSSSGSRPSFGGSSSSGSRPSFGSGSSGFSSSRPSSGGSFGRSSGSSFGGGRSSFGGGRRR